MSGTMEIDEQEFNRLKQELDKMKEQKAKNKLRAEESERNYNNSIIEKYHAEKTVKFKAQLYTLITVGGFCINPVFGVFCLLFCIADMLFDFLKIGK